MKISLLLPYWNRQEAADKALNSLRQYDLDLEIIVVDDGSEVPFRSPEGLPIKVITLPKKDGPKSPVTCWNAAAKEATGDVLVISCVEVLHDKPILEELTENLGEDEYRLASAWCPEENRWHTHSTVHVPDCPNGTGLGFCAAIKPDLYWKAGGFDEDYREGAGYEDRDWIKRLLKVGAKFTIRDDLTVIHPKTGAHISWGSEKFKKNREIYRQKWPEKDILTVVCLNAGNYLGLGAQYVNTLADMVRKHMPQDVSWRFVCLTDDPRGLVNGIEMMPLPKDLKGWWGKLYLFKKGLFPEGSRVVFFDLDTLITGSLDKIIRYSGDMAILRDFFFPDRVGPGVFLWKAGFGSRIWEEWEAKGRPEDKLGDLWWINQLDNGKFAKGLHKLQDLYPGSFVSYKADCQNGLPKRAKVVCFHGNPRPHHYPSPWVKNIWRMEFETKVEKAEPTAFHVAQQLIDSERYQEALQLLNKNLDDDPDNLSALFQFGEALLKMDRVGMATVIYRYLSMLAPNRSEVWNNLGRCYQKKETSKEARACFKKALELDINSAAALTNLAVMDVNEGRPDRAVILAQKALSLSPNARQAYDVVAMGKLAMRDWSGWHDYMRSEGPPFRNLRQYTVPSEAEWMGEKGKTVVVYREQGLGDEILFASCLQEVIDDSKKVIVDCDKRLVGLLQRSFPQADVYGTGYSKELDWPKNYQIDASAPMGRIPAFYRRKDSDYPGTAYLKACPLRKKAYRAMLASLGMGPKVGIAWTGGKRTDTVTKSDAEYRSLSLDQIKPLLLPGHHYISLEYRPAHDEIKTSGLPIHDWPWITQSHDYDDTAALVDELDYIIAVPTTVVHLAGALGKTCYCLTPEHSNFRFGVTGEDMIWHKSVKQFRGNDRVEKLAQHLNKHEVRIIQAR